MARDLDLHVKHVTRIEGHGTIVVRARDGVIEKNEWQVPEAPRFFEAMVRGRKFEDIQTIVSRICGICSVTHSLVAIKAVEQAMGITISQQTDTLRLLTHYGEQLESHSLHLGYLVAPDLLGAPSVVPLLTTHPDVVKTIIAIHKVGNKMMERLAGRKTHPVRLLPGGFAMLPTEAELRELKQDLEDTLPRLGILAEVVAQLAEGFPDFERETEYVALVKPDAYPFYHGNIGSSDTEERVPPQEFERVVNEYVVPQSTAKWARWHRESYAVGALARFKLNHDHLLPEAAKVAGDLGLSPACCNPFLNNMAQVIECVQVVVRSLQMIDSLLDVGIEYERPSVKPVAGQGAAAIEAPRGILFHRYAFDEDGICVSANMSIPTNQNHANIQKDFEAFVPQIIDQEEEDIRRQMEMLVRSYDPCVSCSTHYLKVEFV